MKVKHTWNGVNPLMVAAIGEGLAATGKLYEVAIYNVVGHTPPLTKPDLLTACTRVRTGNGNKKADPTELKNAVKDLKKILNDFAEFVDGIAKGDQAKIESTSFEATSGERHDATIPGTPDTPTGKSVDSVMDLTVDTVNGAAYYIWFIFLNGVFEITVDDGHFVIPAINTGVIVVVGTSHEKLRNLPKGKHAFIGVMAGNTAGLSPMSSTTDAWTN